MIAYVYSVCRGRAAAVFLLVAYSVVVAAASFSGYMGKWGYRDNSERNNITKMLNGTADKPFVYRRLIPEISAAVAAYVPPAIQNAVVGEAAMEKTFVAAKSPLDVRDAFQRLLIAYMVLISLAAALLVLRAALVATGVHTLTATISSTALVLALPYFQTGGGYFYDAPELLFLATSVYLSVRGSRWALITVVLFATLNKETFFFFVPTLYPLLRGRNSSQWCLVTIGVAILAAAIANAVLKLAYWDSPGGAAEWHLFENLRNYGTLWFYGQTELTYGVIGPEGVSMLTLALIAVITVRGWACTPGAWRQHIALAAAVSAPLLLAFSATGELRNLSFLYVGFAFLMAAAIDPGQSKLRPHR